MMEKEDINDAIEKIKYNKKMNNKRNKEKI